MKRGGGGQEQEGRREVGGREKEGDGKGEGRMRDRERGRAGRHVWENFV